MSVKKIILILVGLIPYLLGYVINYLYSSVLPNISPPYVLIGIAFLMCWFLFSFLMCNFAPTKLQTVGFANLIALANLFLLLFQEVIAGRYWSGLLGFLTQGYYIALIQIETILFSFINNSAAFTYIVSFILMCAVSYFGCCLGRYTKDKKDKGTVHSNPLQE